MQSAALRWLQQQQNQDGSWSCPPSDLAGTSLALLAFLKRGETPDSKEFGMTVVRGLTRLVKSVDEQGWVKGRDRYTQAVVTCALVAGYEATNAWALRRPLERMLKLNAGLLDQADGFELAWFAMGLRSAQLAGFGLEVPTDVTDAVRERLWKQYRENGQFADAQGQVRPELTGAFVHCLQRLGSRADPRLVQSLELLRQQSLDWRETTSAQAWESWYFVAEAMFQGGQKYWQYWAGAMKTALFESQHADGRWEPPPKAPREPGLARSNVQATALNCAAFPPISTRPLWQELERTPRPLQ